MSSPLLTATDVANARFDDKSDDPDVMPSDEVFLQKFVSQILPRPSEELTGALRGGQPITEAREKEKRLYLERARAEWRAQRDAQKRHLSEKQKRQAAEAEFAAGAASGRFRRELVELLERYRASRASEQELAARLEAERTEEKRICREMVDVVKLAKAIANQRDLLTAIQIRLERLRAEQLELVAPLRTVYSSAKRTFVLLHADLVKRFPGRQVEINRAVNFMAGAGGIGWPFEQHNRREQDLSAAELMQASFGLETRFSTLDQFTSPQAKTSLPRPIATHQITSKHH